MIDARELNKTRTTHQRTDDNFDKELWYVKAELAKGGSILAHAIDLARKAKKNFVELQEARNPLIPNQFQILVAAKCMAKKAELVDCYRFAKR